MPKIPLQTRAEATQFRETSRHADVVTFLQQLASESDLVQLQSLGRSSEGQDIIAAVLSDRHAASPERCHKQGKLIVMIEANIHAGEVEGKEAVLALARDLTRSKRGRRLLEALCLVIIPDLNPDGNDRISVHNRALNLAQLEGQENPEGGVGTRYSGEGWNLNRDNMKQEAAESRALAAFYQQWWPHLFIDCHTTDGSIHGYDLTFDTSRNNRPLFPELARQNRRLLERVAAKVEKRHGFASQWYGNFADPDDPHSGWQTYPPLPRFGSHYRGLLGRFDVLLETYSYLSFERRVAVTAAWLLELCRYAAKQRSTILRTCDDEAQRILRRGIQADPQPQVAIQHGIAYRQSDGRLSFRYPTVGLGDEIDILSFDQDSLKERRYPGVTPQTYRVADLRHTVPQQLVTTPAAYLIDAAVAPRLADHLSRHGIAFTRLDSDFAGEVESYTILAIEPTFSPDVAGQVPPPGGSEIALSTQPPPQRFETVLSVRRERHQAHFGPGSLRVDTAQRAGTLAVYLLEPHADDGLARWQLLDAELQVGGRFPIARLLHDDRPPPRPTSE